MVETRPSQAQSSKERTASRARDWLKENGRKVGWEFSKNLGIALLTPEVKVSRAVAAAALHTAGVHYARESKPSMPQLVKDKVSTLKTVKKTVEAVGKARQRIKDLRSKGEEKEVEVVNMKKKRGKKEASKDTLKTGEVVLIYVAAVMEGMAENSKPSRREARKAAEKKSASKETTTVDKKIKRLNRYGKIVTTAILAKGAYDYYKQRKAHRSQRPRGFYEYTRPQTTQTEKPTRQERRAEKQFVRALSR